MSGTTLGYETFKAHQQQLTDLFRRTQPVLQHLDMKGWLENVGRLTGRVATDTFKVIVLGEFKRGKSTFINALLGEEILPAFATPCTAVINEIRWSKQKKAVLVFRDPLPDALPPTLPEAAREHIRRAAGSAVPPLEIPVTDLESYVVIPDPAQDQAQSVAETPYDHVKLYWPIELCSQGVTIIDSPGLNEHGTRTRITMDYLLTVDAVLFVLSCQALASKSEMDVIEQNVRGAGHEDVFFICNRFDEIRERERERLVKFGREKLRAKTSFGSDGVFFLSALDALEGRLAADPAREAGSGLPPFEKALARFLVQDRGKVKLLQPARELMRAIKEGLHDILPRQRKMLEESLGSLQQRYDEKKPLLDDAERRAAQIGQKLRHHQERLRDEVRGLAAERLREVAGRLPEWAQELKPENAVSFPPTKSKIQKLVEEVSRALTARIEMEQSQWQREKLQPLLQNRLTEMGQAVSQSVDDLLKELDQVKADVSGLQSGLTADERPISGLERALAAAGGFLIGGAGSALVGATLGYKEMLKSLGPQIALVIVGVFVIGLNPLLILPLLIGAGVLQGYLQAGSLTKTVTQKVAANLAAIVKDKTPEMAEKMAEYLFQQTGKLALAVQAGLEKEIRAVRDQVEAVIATKQAGEAQVRGREKELKAVETEIKAIDTALTDFIFVVATPGPH
jgi:hypothetical protein